MKGIPELADSTGFSPEGVQQAMKGFREINGNLNVSDWVPESLFGDGGKIADLFGVMLKVPQLKRQLENIGGAGFDHSRISNITRDWVNGRRLDEIAQEYFSQDGKQFDTDALTNACKAIYRVIVNNGTWGVSALSRVSGIDFETLSEDERRQINTLPAMIYHGVKSEEAVLMRMNSAPRSASEALGAVYREASGGDETLYSVGHARSFLKDLADGDWDQVRPANIPLSGAGYKRIWEVLSGKAD